MSKENKDHIYWGIDATNKLIISDQPVTTATENRAGSFRKTAIFYYKGIYSSIVTTAPWGAYADTITSIEVQGHVAPISTWYWFAGLKNVESIDVTQLDTSNVTTMQSMFYATGSKATTFMITGMDNWETSNVTDMSQMFQSAGQNAKTFTIIGVGNWNTSNVTDMSYMFSYAGKNATTFELDLSNWDTSKVTDMSNMFLSSGENAITWDIGDLSTKTVTVEDKTYTAWDMLNVNNMMNMFSEAGRNATTWNIGDISNWDTSNVTDMSYMFFKAGENAITWSIGNITNWETDKVESTYNMFDSVHNMTTIKEARQKSNNLDKVIADINNNKEHNGSTDKDKTADIKKKIFKIPVTWEVWDKVEIEAETIEEAIQYVKDNLDELPLGTEPEYIDGSYKIDDGNNGAATVEETVEHLKYYWNINDDKELNDLNKTINNADNLKDKQNNKDINKVSKDNIR